MRRLRVHKVAHWISRRPAVALGFAAAAPAVIASFVFVLLTAFAPVSMRHDAVVDSLSPLVVVSVVVSIVLLAAGALVIGLCEPFTVAVRRGLAVGAVATTVVWISLFGLAKAWYGSRGASYAIYEGIADLVLFILAPVALTVGAGGAGLIAGLTRVIRNAITRPTERLP